MVLDHPYLFIQPVLPLHQVPACSLSVETFHASQAVVSLPPSVEPLFIHISFMWQSVLVCPTVACITFIAVHMFPFCTSTRLETPLEPVLLSSLTSSSVL